MANSDNFALINVGRTGTGKTTVSKKLINSLPSGNNLIIYDINREYTEYYKHPFEPDINIFMTDIKNVTNSFILIEEASIFFQNRETNKELKEMLVLKRHNNNIIVLNFHSFAMIPDYLFHLVNYITIMKTNDSEKKVKTKFAHDELLHTMHVINSSKDPYAKMTVKL